MAKNKKRQLGFLRPASDFPTPLFMVTISLLVGFAAGVIYAVQHLL